jgi:hypothetical protein
MLFWGPKGGVEGGSVMCECLFTQRDPFACLKAVPGGDVEMAVGNMLEMTFPMTAEILKTTGV